MRYVPHTPADVSDMLATIGVGSIDELFESIPEEFRLTEPLNLPGPLDELSLMRHMAALARQNVGADQFVSFLGAGIYDHFVPAVVDTIVSRGEFLTSYTPYQPELSQGMLQAIYEYQSLICALTDMDMANASMYDAATALAEAALMLVEVTGRRRVLVSRTVHPHYRQVIRTYLEAADIAYTEVRDADGRTDPTHLHELASQEVACVLVQHPTFFGYLEDLPAVASLRDKLGIKCVAAADPVAMALLKPPGSYGFDVVVGEGQPLAGPMAFGGPLLGFFAFREEYFRRFPGRIVGKTRDSAGRRGFTMTLRTREQDIRREKATSNICTNETLLALAMAVHLCALGPSGLRTMAEVSTQKAHFTRDLLRDVPGVKERFVGPFFKEFVIRLDTRRPVHDVCRTLRGRGVLAGYPLAEHYPDLSDCLLVCVTEKRTREEIERFASELHCVMEGGSGE